MNICNKTKYTYEYLFSYDFRRYVVSVRHSTLKQKLRVLMRWLQRELSQRTAGVYCSFKFLL